MMKTRNQRLVILFLFLLAANIGFLLLGGKSSQVSFEENLFVLTDTASVETIRIQNEDTDVSLQRNPLGWELNETYPADEGLRRLFMSIMQRVQVKKPVDIDIPETAASVTISGSNPLAFQAWGNLTKTRTYFSMNNGKNVYEVIIPGYNEYLGQIFELKKDQWRDRLVFNGSWRTIQELTLDYVGADENDFTIRFDESFFKVDLIQAIDSNAVVDYLNQFQYFEVNEWISQGRFARYDSLSRMPPLASLTIYDINLREPVIFDMFPSLKNEPFHLVADQQGNLMVIDRKRMLGILRKRSDFMAID